MEAFGIFGCFSRFIQHNNAAVFQKLTAENECSGQYFAKALGIIRIFVKNGISSLVTVNVTFIIYCFTLHCTSFTLKNISS
jgi:hypothetical protein